MTRNLLARSSVGSLPGRPAVRRSRCSSRVARTFRSRWPPSSTSRRPGTGSTPSISATRLRWRSASTRIVLAPDRAIVTARPAATVVFPCLPSGLVITIERVPSSAKTRFVRRSRRASDTLRNSGSRRNVSRLRTLRTLRRERDLREDRHACGLGEIRSRADAAAEVLPEECHSDHRSPDRAALRSRTSASGWDRWLRSGAPGWSIIFNSKPLDADLARARALEQHIGHCPRRVPREHRVGALGVDLEDGRRLVRPHRDVGQRAVDELLCGRLRVDFVCAAVA